MKPSSIRRWTRRETWEAERCTRSPSSALVSRPSVWSSARSFRSNPSRPDASTMRKSAGSCVFLVKSFTSLQQNTQKPHGKCTRIFPCESSHSRSPGDGGRQRLQPDGDPRFRVRRVHRTRRLGPDPGVPVLGLRASRHAPLQERDPVPPGRDQLHPERRGQGLPQGLPRPARSERLRHRDPRRRCAQGDGQSAGAGRQGADQRAGPDGTGAARHRGDRRQPDLLHRPL